MDEVSPRWMALVGLVMLVGVSALAFVDHEIVRADATTARTKASDALGTCLYGSAAFTIADRQRRQARCASLPRPQAEAQRVERRWERRSPLYGLAASAIFLTTAVMFVQSRRRRATSAMLDSARRPAWRITTVAVSFVVGMMIWSALLYLIVNRWDGLVDRLAKATGGSTHDCDLAGVECGVLGEFAYAHPTILFSLLVAASVIPAAVVTFLLARLLRSLDRRPDHPPLGPPVMN